MDACVKVLVETRLHGPQYESVCNRCQKQGYELVAVASNPLDFTGHNGIFIMVKRPIVIQKVEHIGQLEQWRDVARVQVAKLVFPSGQEIKVVAAYCYADDAVRRQAMHEDLIEYVASEKNAKCLLVGDFNQDAGTVWPMEVAKTTGALTDL
eukprot:1409723-Amphidinium_carterae.1